MLAPACGRADAQHSSPGRTCGPRSGLARANAREPSSDIPITVARWWQIWPRLRCVPGGSLKPVGIGVGQDGSVVQQAEGVVFHASRSSLDGWRPCGTVRVRYDDAANPFHPWSSSSDDHRDRDYSHGNPLGYAVAAATSASAASSLGIRPFRSSTKKPAVSFRPLLRIFGQRVEVGRGRRPSRRSVSLFAVFLLGEGDAEGGVNAFSRSEVWFSAPQVQPQIRHVVCPRLGHHP